MKSLNIKFPFTVNDLLSFFDKLDTRDLQGISDKISTILSKRNNPTPEEKDAKLVAIIKEQLPSTFLNRYNELQFKMETGILDKSNIPELEAYAEQIEAFDTKKIEALSDLAKLRKIPFQKLAADLAAFPRIDG
ncbi:MAG: hypothetical protein AB8G86_11600 [Saprospiraceae bacterium]